MAVTSEEWKSIRKDLLEEKKKQLEKLKKEIKELESPTSISTFCNNRMIYPSREKDGSYTIKTYHCSGAGEWNEIKNLCMQLMRYKYCPKKNDRLYVRDLSAGEVKLLASMGDEIIDIWNRYVRRVYQREEQEV